jgi:alcohol dehydrogenase class IV
MNAGLVTEPVRGSAESAERKGGFSPEGNTPAAASRPSEKTPATLQPITLIQPGRILFGNACFANFVEHLKTLGLKHLFVVTSQPVLASCGQVIPAMQQAGIKTTVFDLINAEPTIGVFEECLAAARRQPFEGVIGLGGGSPMDVAKLVAALADGAQTIGEVLGINQLRGRRAFLACLPTTSGTGSEVSPNAILLDEASQLKKAAISPHLVPDVACVDPLLTHSVPPALTAATGLDAITHCIEAYANRFAHPLVDLHALQGVRLIARSLLSAVQNGRDSEARANLALGSLHGGLCLGPVNTAAVHALAYPLGSEFKVAHGVSNAVLLPHVLRFNLPAMPERYADIALALGAEPGGNALATAERGVQRLAALVRQCPIPQSLSELGVPKDAIPRLVKSALTVTRLLKNNPRAVTADDALEIYTAAY